MSGTITVITDASAPAETLNGARLIDLSARTSPIALTLTGTGTETTQFILGSALVTVNAAADADALSISGGSGALFLRAGGGVLSLSGQAGPAYVTGGSGTAAIAAAGPLDLLAGTGLMTVTGNLAGLALYGNQPGYGYLPEAALQAQAGAPLTQVTTQFVPSGQARTVNGSVYGNDNEIGTATTQGAGPTYFIESFAQAALNEPAPSVILPFAAGPGGATLTAPPVPNAPTATAAWNAGTGTYAITVSGQANAANEGVFISVDGNLVATVASAADGTFTASATVGTAGSHTVTASVYDPALGQFDDSAAGTFAAPPAIIAADGAAPANTVSATGLAAANATVSIAVDGITQPETTTADNAGNWTIDLRGAFGGGSHSVVVTSDGVASAPFTETIVAAVPPAITSVLRNDAAPAGTAFSMTGRATPGATVTIVVDGAATGQTVIADGTGAWSADVSGIGAGTHSVDVTAPDLTGAAFASAAVPVTVAAPPVIAAPAVSGGTLRVTGTTAATGAVTVSVDGVALPPVSPVAGAFSVDLPALAGGAHTIIASQDEALTATPGTATESVVVPNAPTIGASVGGGTLMLSGSADAGAAVTVHQDNQADQTVVADPTGHWSLTEALPTSAAQATATVTDPFAAAGFVASAALPLPVVPVIASAGFTPPSTDLIVTGTADAGAAITVAASPSVASPTVSVATPASITPNVTVAADGSGHFTANLGPQPSGGYAVTASTPDQYGPALTSPPVSIFVPSSPVILSAIVDPAGAVVVTGLADPLATVSVRDGATVDGTVQADTTGTWSYTIQSPGPVASVTATVSPAGFVALGSQTVSPPYTSAPPVITGADPAASAGEFFSVTGHATPNVPLTLSLDGSALASVTTDQAGNWFYDQTAPVSAGPHTVSVQTAGAPAASAVSAPVVVASRPPTLAAYDNPAAPVGTVLSLRGTADAGAVVTLTANGGALPVSVTAAADGTWSADLSGLSGTETLGAFTHDANDQRQLTAAGVTVTVPAAPTLAYAAIAPNASGAETLTVDGAAPAGTPVTLTDHVGAVIATVTADAAGRFGLTTAIDPATLDLTTIAAGVADPYAPGSISTAVTTPFASAAVAPAITTVGPDQPATAGTLAVSGTANPGAEVTVVIEGGGLTAAGPSSVVQANADGVWAARIAAPAPGDYAVTASVPSGAATLRSAPSALHLAATPALSSEDTSAAPAGVALELHGTSDPNALVYIALDGQAATTVNADAQGRWTDDVAAIAAGAHTMQVAVFDPARGVPLTGNGAFTLTAPAITAANVDGAHFVTLSGTATAGEAVTLASDALARPLLVTADANGAWQAGFTAGAGPHSVTASAFDPGRNTQASSGATAFAVPVASSAPATDPLELALQAAQAATAGTSIGAAVGAIPAAGAVRSQTIAAGQSGTVAVGAGAQLVISDAAGPVTLAGNGGANAIIRNAGGTLTFLTNGGSGTFLDGGSATNDHFQSPLAGGGDYVIQLGSGNNLVEAKSGDTTVTGGAGSNSVWLGSGAATVTLQGVGRDTVVTGSGTASVHALGTANELVYQGAGTLTFDNNNGTATVAGGAGSSTIHAWGGSGVFWGGAGGHSELSANSNCTLVSRGDNDHLLAWGHHNELWAVHGNATIQAVGGGDNLLVGGDGNDWMAGFGAGDTLLGGLGNSTLWGGAGDELIHLSEKSAVAYAGNGNETLIGGAGPDTYVFFKRPGVNTYEVQGFTHGKDHMSFADRDHTDAMAAIQYQTRSASGVTLTLGDGTKIVFAGLDKVTTADVI